jgi:hypothetical protein
MTRTIFLFIAMITAVVPVFAQTPAGSPDPQIRTESNDPVTASQDLKRPTTSPAVPAAPNGYVRPTGKERFKAYIKSMFGPGALATRAAKSGFYTWTNSPEEWGPTWEGFGRRFASSTGTSIIKNSTMYGLDEVLKVDSRFYRSKKRDIGSRIKNALLTTVTSRRPDGSRTFGIPKIAGTYAASIIAAEAWYPDRYDWKDGLRGGTFSLGFHVGWNLFKEFVHK